MLPAIVAVVFATLIVQLAALWGMGRRRPVGDEESYLAHGSSQDPQLFVRPPAFLWLAALCHGGADGADVGERRLRLLTAVTSFLTVVLVAVTGWRIGGPAVAFLSTLMLAAQPERILLGCHIWPDTFLALKLAGLGLVLTLPPEPALAFVAGGLCTLGVLSRIDFLVVLPLLLAAWKQCHGSLSDGTVAALLVPPLSALVLLSVHHHRRYGILLPDTTWAFNLMVMASEVRRGGALGSFEIERGIHDTVVAWRRLNPAQAACQGIAALWDTLRSPRLFGHGVARRLLTLLGPDTFIRQKLLPRDAAYPELGDEPRWWWDTALKVAFPFLAAVGLTTAVVGLRIPGCFAWPSLGLMAVPVLVHARTRYRLTAMPALSLVVAQEVVQCVESLSGRPLAAASVTVGIPLLLWALLRIRCSVEFRG